ncbi:MAG: sugar ABC transporter permease [Brevibacterium sp.]|uniref:Carbohydrate ABC transporter membrane protein 1, CUT1 family n=1 Tax=Tessaracoccus bendigoensis DSM 12906 TaxID=1123357 RepID=A0A1M6F6G4_9ACTN|nr:sugar ABC transporter permease [Tessaracoccus bendigoensis]MDN5552149.1 sugar ABC transporter permease [Brevibacterium sp.]SHI93271.1 carbohydrate ABC transporter membrane protein 1, CUT1 family [Tessaracoccus bendigoensis DSM 12906]
MTSQTTTASRQQTSAMDKATPVLMGLIPTLVVVGLIWIPALFTVILSFTSWDGVGALSGIEFIGGRNYVEATTVYPTFWPAIGHNVLWLVGLFVVFTPLGMFLAVLLDKEIRGSRFYQTSFYLPVVLSAALIGFIWQLMYSRDQGLLNMLFGTQIDWYGDPNINIWAAIVATGWRHTGYVMLLYLAGLKGIDPALREAAQMDGANQFKTYVRIIFPVMRPINIIVMTITFIEGLRAFDLPWVINRGRNGLELISTLVTSNVAGEASRIGFGSALATLMLILSSIFIIFQLRVVMKGEDR